MLEKLKEIAGADNVRADEPMSMHTTFRAGGAAAYFVEPESIEALSALVKYLNIEKKPYYILGNGSNILVKDSGYNGVIIKIGEAFNQVKVCKADKNQYIVQAGGGAMLSRAAKLAADNSLTGMETLSGIPGTVGGAVTMNAGAYGGEVRDIIESATVMDKEGNLFKLISEELNLSYRHSIIQEKKYIVLEAVFTLNAAVKDEILKKMAEYAEARRTKQPLEYPSAGSTFKRPKGYFAGKLIMDAGLKGYRYGGAMVSEKHCGFVINAGNATASDIIKVIDNVKATVKQKFNVDLESEVKILG